MISKILWSYSLALFNNIARYHRLHIPKNVFLSDMGYKQT